MARRSPRQQGSRGWRTLPASPPSTHRPEAARSAATEERRDEPPETAAPAFGERPWEQHLVVALLSLIVQAVQYQLLSGDPSVTGPIIDGREYHAEALRIAQGGAAPPLPHWQSPLFAWALALVYRLVDARPAVGLIAQSIFAVAIAQLLVVVARTVLPPRAVIAVGVCAALYGPLLFFSSQLIAAPLDAALALLALAVAVRSSAASAPWVHLAQGLALGAAVAARGTVAPFGLFLLWRIVQARAALPLPALAARAAALGAGVFGGLLPVGLSTLQRYGVFRLATANAGVNLFVGNNSDVTGTTAIRPGWRWDDLTFEPARHGVFEPFAQSAFFTDRAVAWATHHPYAFVRALLAKLVDTFNGVEIARNLDPYGSLGRTALTAALLWEHGLRFPFGLVLPMAAVGALSALRDPDATAPRRGAWRALVAFVGLNALGIALFFPSGRYRLGLALAMLVPAVEGARTLARWWSARAVDRRIAAVGAALLVAANTVAPMTGPDLRAEGPLQLSWAHLSAGRVADAVRVLTEETGRRPDDADVWRTLGEARDRAGDQAGAIAALQQAVLLAPRNAHARHHLGAILFTTGRAAEARVQLESAVRLWPAHPLAWIDLAGACLDTGDPEAAKRAGDEAVRHNPGGGYGWYYRGLARQRTGDLAGAVEDLTRAARLLPAVMDVRLALVEAIDATGRRADALGELRDVLRASPRNRRARALLRRWEPPAR
jgi:tetratricopeptide (TPR) repeat protein